MGQYKNCRNKGQKGEHFMGSFEEKEHRHHHRHQRSEIGPEGHRILECSIDETLCEADRIIGQFNIYVMLEEAKSRGQKGAYKPYDQYFFYKFSLLDCVQQDKEEGESREVVQRGKNGAHYGSPGSDPICVGDQLIDTVAEKGEKVCVPQRCNRTGYNNKQG